VIYADTNVLLSLYCPDDLSEPAAAWYGRNSTPVSISPWTVIGFRANIGLRVRKRMLTRAMGIATMELFDEAVSANFHLLSPAPEHFNQACDWLAKPDCALRSSDALHLAIAFGERCRQFISFDQPLGVAAKKLGLSCLLLRPKK